MSKTQRKSEYSDFKPLEYLEEYYTHIGSENQFLLEMSAKAYQDFDTDSAMLLEVGGGPTIYQLISSARCATEIHFTDYAQQNLDEVDRWVKNQSEAFNWDNYITQALQVEGKSTTRDAVEARKALIRRKLTQITPYDLFQSQPPATGTAVYDIVSSYFSSDAIAHSLPEWKEVLQNIVRLLKKDSWLILIGVLGSDAWVMMDEVFTATNLDEKTILAVLQDLGLHVELFQTHPAETNGDQGYDAVYFVKARKQG